MLRKKSPGQGGFTLVELMVVIAVIAILAAISIPNYVAYRQRGHNAAAKADAKNAYSAAQAYFVDNPTGTVDNSILQSTGYTPSSGVVLSINNNTQSALEFTTTHPGGSKTYTVHSNGAISET